MSLAYNMIYRIYLLYELKTKPTVPKTSFYYL